jgi:hypothetical protein
MVPARVTPVLTSVLLAWPRPEMTSWPKPRCAICQQAAHFAQLATLNRRRRSERRHAHVSLLDVDQVSLNMQWGLDSTDQPAGVCRDLAAEEHFCQWPCESPWPRTVDRHRQLRNTDEVSCDTSARLGPLSEHSAHRLPVGQLSDRSKENRGPGPAGQAPGGHYYRVLPFPFVS